MSLTVAGRIGSFAATCAALLLLASGTPVAQSAQNAPVFRAAANLVEVMVRVTDEEGRFVPNLTITDFEILDEGRPQTIVAFDRRDLPRGATPPPGAGKPVLAAPEMSTVTTNDGAAEARLFVLVLDDMNTPSSELLSVRRTTREFVERYVGLSDLVAVFPTSGRGVVTQEFTTDKTRILAAVDQYMGMGGGGYGGYAGRVFADVVKMLARHLNGIRGRRTSLVLVGASALGLSDFYERQAIEALRRANVTLYVIDPRRLFVPGMGGEDWGGGDYGSSPAALREFAELVGGFAAVQTNVFDEAFERIVDENSQYYVLGFQPTTRGHDGDFRQIRVRVPAQPKLQVSARPGYVVGPPPKPSPRPRDVSPVLASALVNNLPTGGLPLRVQVIPRRGAKVGTALVHVVVEIAGQDLPFAEAGGRHHAQLGFALRTIDRLARSDNNRKATITLNLTSEQLAGARRTGVRWVSMVNLRPGRYSLRVAGEAIGTNQIGSVYADIDVPKFNDELWIGGLALTSLPAALAVSGGTTAVALGLPGPPTTTRTFVVGDVVTVSAEVTTRRDFTTGTLELTVRPQADDAAEEPLLRRTVELADRAAALKPRAWAVDTKTLGAGQFVLRLAMRDARGRSAETAVLFDVVGR